MNVAAREGEECIREILNCVSVEESAQTCQGCEGEGEDDVSSVDIMSGISADGKVESEGWKFAKALARANRSVKTLADGFINTSQLPTC